MECSQLTVANEFVGIDYASDAPVVPGFGAGIGLIGPHHAAAALNHNIVLAARNVRRQGNLKLDGRADLERCVGADVNAGGAQIAGHATGFTRGIFLMNLDRQMQRKPFPGTRFGHDSSSALALRFNRKPENQGRNQARKPQIPSPKPNEQLTALYHTEYSRRNTEQARGYRGNTSRKQVPSRFPAVDSSRRGAETRLLAVAFTLELSNLPTKKPPDEGWRSSQCSELTSSSRLFSSHPFSCPLLWLLCSHPWWRQLRSCTGRAWSCRTRGRLPCGKPCSKYSPTLCRLRHQRPAEWWTGPLEPISSLRFSW